MTRLVILAVLTLFLSTPALVEANDVVDPEEARMELCRKFRGEAKDRLSEIGLGKRMANANFEKMQAAADPPNHAEMFRLNQQANEMSEDLKATVESLAAYISIYTRSGAHATTLSRRSTVRIYSSLARVAHDSVRLSALLCLRKKSLRETK